jgi:hypothetical protein
MAPAQLQDQLVKQPKRIRNNMQTKDYMQLEGNKTKTKLKQKKEKAWGGILLLIHTHNLTS